jgi:hypothetical protein
LLHCLHLSRLGENRRARKRTREGEDTDRGERSVAVRRHRYRAQRLLVFSQGWLYSQLHVSNLGALFAGEFDLTLKHLTYVFFNQIFRHASVGFTRHDLTKIRNALYFAVLNIFIRYCNYIFSNKICESSSKVPLKLKKKIYIVQQKLMPLTPTIFLGLG